MAYTTEVKVKGIVEKSNVPPRKKGTEETFISNMLTFFDTSWNTFKLMSKSHFRGSSFYLGNVLIPMMISLGVLAFMTIQVGFIWIMFLSVTFAGLATYGTLFFSIRKSTMIKNIEITANETTSLYFATFFVMLVSIFLTMAVCLLSMFILDKTGYAMTHLMFGRTDVSGDDGAMLSVFAIQWLAIQWSMIIYYGFVQTFLCFSMAFFIEQTTNTQRNFFLIVLIYIVAGIFFAGIFSGTLYVSEDGSISVIDISDNLEDLDGIAAIPGQLKGTPMWVVSQLFPHYGLNQIAMNTITHGSYHPLSTGKDWTNWHEVNIFETTNSAWATYYIVVPWIWSAVLISIGANIERYGENV